MSLAELSSTIRWALHGSFMHVPDGAVIYYQVSPFKRSRSVSLIALIYYQDLEVTNQSFPENFFQLSGDNARRSCDYLVGAGGRAQQTNFICLGDTSVPDPVYSQFPRGVKCQQIRMQVNYGCVLTLAKDDSSDSRPIPPIRLVQLVLDRRNT
jgi:hypothetical protein